MVAYPPQGCYDDEMKSLKYIKTLSSIAGM